MRHFAHADRPADEDVRHWRPAIDLALADILYREQIGRQLQKRYTEFLAAK